MLELFLYNVSCETQIEKSETMERQELINWVLANTDGYECIHLMDQIVMRKSNGR